MTREERQKAIDALKISVPVRAATQEEFNDYIQILNKVMDWLEQEPCEDAVSREAVLDALHVEGRPTKRFDYVVEVRRDIEALPPVTPKQKTGKYEWVQYDYNPKLGNWHCSECRCVIVECVEKNRKDGIPRYKYCPNCGAKMEGEDEE